MLFHLLKEQEINTEKNMPNFSGKKNLFRRVFKKKKKL